MWKSLNNFVNDLIMKFLKICEYLGVTIASEKTEWATVRLVFLGILLDGEFHILAVPKEKRLTALHELLQVRDKHTVTLQKIESMVGLLNFLGRAIFPGRVFTRRMYSKFAAKGITKSGKRLRKFHHISLDAEFKLDCEVWIQFLSSQHMVC